MKKILAILLLICCMFSVVSCAVKTPDNTDEDNNKKDSPLNKFEEMFASSAPTKSNTVINETFNDIVLKSEFTVTTGTVDGGKVASIYESEVQQLNEIKTDLNYIKTRNQTNWYYEGLGTSTNKGRTWDADGKNFAPSEGFLSMMLVESYIDNYEYSSEDSTETLVLNLSAANAVKVLSNFVGSTPFNEEVSDVVVTIVAAGERISSIKIEYELPDGCYIYVGDDYDNFVYVEYLSVVIEANYSYDIQNITFE